MISEDRNILFFFLYICQGQYKNGDSNSMTNERIVRILLTFVQIKNDEIFCVV